jgi:RNA polymerase sigma factor (sigma-70 family)
MSEPRALVEHFFRHEFGRLVALLTRSLGVRRLALVEDVVQAALVQALETWSRRGVPEHPAGWLYRTARNLAIDALRRERTHAQALPRLAEDDKRDLSPLEAHFADEIGDEPLRLLFVCCHEAVPAESRVAIALRTLCGFSTAEIARALLTTEANVQKRIERARDRLRELDVDFDTPAAPQLCARLDAVLAVVYLLFSQGCHVTHGAMPIRRDLCDEARRLARMLAAPAGHDSYASAQRRRWVERNLILRTRPDLPTPNVLINDAARMFHCREYVTVIGLAVVFDSVEFTKHDGCAAIESCHTRCERVFGVAPGGYDIGSLRVRLKSTPPLA